MTAQDLSLAMLEALEPRLLLSSGPTITNTAHAPVAPTPDDAVWVTANVTDPDGVADVTLTYEDGAGGGGGETPVFLETMGTTAVKPWTGATGSDNPWTVTGSYFELRTAANYLTSTTDCGMEYKGTATNNALTSAMVATSNGISAAGTSGSVEFYVRTQTLDGTDGWTFQLDSGSGYVTRLSELAGSSHGFQTYHYDLASGELVNGLKMRFQFTGGGSGDIDDRIDLDQISISVTTGSLPVDVTMYDDGAHGDGVTGDGVYGGQIPAMANGTTVNYYVTATDTTGAASTDPTGAPTATYSYAVTESSRYDVMLGRPTNDSVAMSVMSRASADLTFYVAYGTASGVYSGQTSPRTIAAGGVVTLELTGLQSNSQYYYRVYDQIAGGTGFQAGTEQAFHTQRAVGETFAFDVQTDFHYMDTGANDPNVYASTAANMLADHPDFLIDLGDTFMTEKFVPDPTTSAVMDATARSLRTSSFSQFGASIPLFLATGNHDSELGWMLDPDAPTDNRAVWSTEAREKYFPSPIPGEFFSGSTTTDPYVQKPRDSYYSFTWGDAQFIVLDPFWYTDPKPGVATGGWGWTLGQSQYDWLQQTLATSQSPFKFVFIHHLVGGDYDQQARGGVEFSKYTEWGGYNQDGTWGFDTHRPGWSMPIQNLLLTYGVDVVFHGHDHLFVKQDLDYDQDGRTDMVYLECPQPSNSGYDKTNTAAGYGYVNYVSDDAGNSGLQGNSGHIRVTVSDTQATIEYVRAYAADDETVDRVNGEVDYSFTLYNEDAPIDFDDNIVLGCPTGDSVVANVLDADDDLDVYIEYGTASGVYTAQTDTHALTAGTPLEIVIDALQSDTQYYYRMRYSWPGVNNFSSGVEYQFQTQRAAGSTFTFSVQGDSHTERASQFDPDLYTITLLQAASDHPDFYLTIGDDFSVDTLDPVTITEADVAERYLIQRPYLGLVGNSAPVFLVNGNHEQAAAYLLDGTPDNVAVWAQNARNLYYSQPAPDDFYTGNTETVEYIGLLRNYFEWTWGDALFVTIDPYWSSPVPVDNVFGGGTKTQDQWEITLGDTQYEWLKTTLEESTAKYKFVFAHHLMGRGRGGTELAPYYEWGGQNADGTWGFDTERPDWDMPIQDLMAANDVTIFFQGHDHVWVKQQLDGVVYQELSEPTDPNYALWNADAYDSNVELPNTGYTRVTVSPDGVQVDYVRTFLPEDEGPGQTTGMVAYSYTIAPPAEIAGRHIFYNRSAWDGNDPTANASDDAAIARKRLRSRAARKPSRTRLLFPMVHPFVLCL